MLKLLKNTPAASQSKQLSPRDYHFYPLFFQVILRSFGNTIYGLALPNYLIFHEHMESGIVGVIYSIFTIAYILGPIIARPITERIGVRNALILAAIIPAITVSIQLLFFTPGVLIACRVIEGIALGLFWPNAQMQVSQWQKICPPNRSEGLFQKYGFSWNFGCLIGGICGYAIVYWSHNDFLGLLLGWAVILSVIPFSFLMKKSEDVIEFRGNRAIIIINHTGTPVMGAMPLAVKIDKRNHKESADKLKTAAEKQGKITLEGATALFLIPVAVSFFVQMVHAISRSMFNFTYPLFLYQAGWDSYWAYLILFTQQFAQMLGINLSGQIGPKQKYYGFLVGCGVVLICSCIIISDISMGWMTAFNILIGFFNGLTYAFGAQVMLAHGKVTGSLKYATIYEIFSAAGYGLTPFIAGFVAERNILYNFQGLAIIYLVSMCLFFIACRKGLQELVKELQAK